MAEKNKNVVAETKPDAIVKETEPTTNSSEQQKKELAFRLLWQAQRVVKGATYREILFYLPQIREWVGKERSEQLEAGWRAGKGN